MPPPGSSLTRRVRISFPLCRTLRPFSCIIRFSQVFPSVANFHFEPRSASGFQLRGSPPFSKWKGMSVLSKPPLGEDKPRISLGLVFCTWSPGRFSSLFTSRPTAIQSKKALNPTQYSDLIPFLSKSSDFRPKPTKKTRFPFRSPYASPKAFSPFHDLSVYPCSFRPADSILWGRFFVSAWKNPNLCVFCTSSRRFADAGETFAASQRIATRQPFINGADI